MYMGFFKTILISFIYSQKWNCWIIWQFYLKFLRNLHTVFHSGYKYTISSTVYEGSLFSTSLQTFVISYLLYNSHSNSCDMISHCDFDLHSLMTSDIKHIFMYLLGFFISFLKKLLFRSFAHFWIGLFWVFIFLFYAVELYAFIIYFGYNIRYMVCKYFSPFYRLSFLLCSFFLLLYRNFLVWCNPTCLFIFCLCFRCHIQKNFAKTHVK